MVRVFSFFLLTFFLLVVPTGAESLKVVTLSSPPLAYAVNGQARGYAVELVREGLRRIGVDATITIVPWKRAVFMTRFGEADAIFYAVRNQARESWFHYPDEPLVVEATVAVRRKGGLVALSPNQTNYAGRRLGVGRGYYYGPTLERFLASAKFAKVEEATSFEMNLSKLLEGRIDVFLSDLCLARHFIRKGSASELIEIVTDKNGEPIVLDAVDSYLAFSRKTVGPQIAKQFSLALRAMKDDGTYERIINSFN